MRLLLASLLSLLAASANAYKTGLMGYGQSWYDPPCAYACRAVIGRAPLDCPSMDHHTDTSEHSHCGSPLAPCIATNSDFLRTLAYCLSTRCGDVSASKLEACWAGQATGDKTVSVEWTYGAALANVTAPPKRTYVAGNTLTYTALVADADYQHQYDFNVFFDWEKAVQSTYVIVLISIGVATPVFFSALDYLSFMTQAIDKIRPISSTHQPFEVTTYALFLTFLVMRQRPLKAFGLSFQSVLWLRHASYEVFLILHIVLAVFVIVGLAKNGMRQASVVELSDEIVRLEVSGVRWSSTPGHHAYTYFPTPQPFLPWQNHPFSIASTALLLGTSAAGSSHSGDVEMSQKTPQVGISQSLTGTGSISLYIKKHNGTKSLLRNYANLPVLLEGPYRGNLSRHVLKCDRVLLIGGGIGITGLLS
ncbi:hypothetical protein FPRO04_09923 [Fusarium proliferatum]|nr:hypothetical protein FPRO04_09923 [Fusarium proliferatum]